MPAATASVSFVSSAPQVITRGDIFSVSSPDAEHGPAVIWFIGRDYFAVKTATADRRNSWTLVLKPEETEKFFAGKYAILVQDPGPDGIMEIERRVADNGNITIQNRGKKIADIGPVNALDSNVEPIVALLDSAAALQGVDDTFSTEYFFVEDPLVQFDQVTDPTRHFLAPRFSGDRIVLTGSTNVGIENSFRVDIRNLASNAIVTSKMIPITAGKEMNCWTYTLEAPGLPSGEYSITLGGLASNATGTGSAFFTVGNPSLPTPPPVGPQQTGSVRPSPPDETPFPFIITTALLIVLIIIIFTTQRK